jgi:hypothetical protein
MLQTVNLPKYDFGSTRIGTLRGSCSAAPGVWYRVPKMVSNTWALGSAPAGMVVMLQQTGQVQQSGRLWQQAVQLDDPDR